jgi:hypothetical protein
MLYGQKSSAGNTVGMRFTPTCKNKRVYRRRSFLTLCALRDSVFHKSLELLAQQIPPESRPPLPVGAQALTILGHPAQEQKNSRSVRSGCQRSSILLVAGSLPIELRMRSALALGCQAASASVEGQAEHTEAHDCQRRRLRHGGARRYDQSPSRVGT